MSARAGVCAASHDNVERRMCLMGRGHDAPADAGVDEVFGVRGF
jgi:hypothetical protein